MRTFLNCLLALGTLTASLAFAPAASAERECLTVRDTAYFYLTYFVGASWSAAYAALSTLGCPGITDVLCTYTQSIWWPDCFVVGITLPNVTVSGTVVFAGGDVEIAVTRDGVSVEAEGVGDPFIKAWGDVAGGLGLPATPGDLVDGASRNAWDRTRTVVWG